MNLKKLHEAALWKKMSEQDFRTNATEKLLLQEKNIEKLSNIITKLTEDIFILRKQFGNMSIQNVKLNQKVNNSNQKMNDDADSKQSGNNNSVS